MSFAPEPNPHFDEDEKKYFKFLAATTFLTVVITKLGDVAADEFKGWLSRRRDAAKKAQEPSAS